MEPVTKTFEVKVLEKAEAGGRILISTPSVDRDRDRVLPAGGVFANYMKNPVVQWGHDYRSPYSTIGRSRSLEITPEGVIADFELRPAANDADPQTVVRLLWDGGWVRTASIGFMPLEAVPNEAGGLDFTKWELLEWSLVPIPANQDALRLAVKSLDHGSATEPEEQTGKGETTPEAEPRSRPVSKRGRVLSAQNERRIRAAAEHLTEVLSQLDSEDGDKGLEAENLDEGLATITNAEQDKPGPDEESTDGDTAELFAEIVNLTGLVREVI